MHSLWARPVERHRVRMARSRGDAVSGCDPRASAYPLDVAGTSARGAGETDLAMFHRLADELIDVIGSTVIDWWERCVTAHGVAITADVRRDFGRQALELTAELRRLAGTDPESQMSTPLQILRASVKVPTAVLRSAEVPPRERDAFEMGAFPDDIYGLSPVSFADIDERLVDPGVAWGAAKAYLHLSRRR